MVIFTKADKVLMMRTARALEQKAEEIRIEQGFWSGTAASKNAKKQYDRLMRDWRDLRMLAKRLEAGLPCMMYPGAAPATEMKTGSTEDKILEPEAKTVEHSSLISA